MFVWLVVIVGILVAVIVGVVLVDACVVLLLLVAYEWQLALPDCTCVFTHRILTCESLATSSHFRPRLITSCHILGNIGAMLSHVVPLLWPWCPILGTTWGHVGMSWGHVEASLAEVGACWAHAAAMLAQIGHNWPVLLSKLAFCGCHIGPPWLSAMPKQKTLKNTGFYIKIADLGGVDPLHGRGYRFFRAVR